MKLKLEMKTFTSRRLQPKALGTANGMLTAIGVGGLPVPLPLGSPAP